MSSSDTSGKICSKMLLLRSSDGEDFQVEESAAGVSGTIKHLLEDGFADGAIPLPNVTGATLAKVVEYCKKHAPPAAGQGDQRPEEERQQQEAAASSASEKDLQTIGEWEEEFMKIDMDTLYDLIQAANYLDVKGLLELTCQRVADLIKGKTPEQIRQTFNIKNDFSPEEEAAVRLENQWEFE